MKNYYKTLGINKTTSREDVKRAYLRLSKLHHPDKGGKSDDFNELKEAFDILYNDESRAEYDETGSFTPKRDYNALAVEALCGLFLETAESLDERSNVLEMMTHHINGIVKGHNEAIKINNKKLEKLNKYSDKVKRKDDRENFLIGALQIKIKSIEHNNVKIGDAITLCEKMLELLDGFLIESNELTFAEEVAQLYEQDQLYRFKRPQIHL